MSVQKSLETYWRHLICISPTLLPWARYDTRSIFRHSLTGLNLDFFSLTGSHNKIKEPSLPYYLRITGESIVGFIPFQSVLALCKMQTAMWRICTWVAMFISYYDTCYIMKYKTCRWWLIKKSLSLIQDLCCF